MEHVIDNLKNKEIIVNGTVERIKRYIAKKYPDSDSVYRAGVFADAVHKILDAHITEFSREEQRRIKGELIRKTALKEEFDIMAYDIMTTCILLEMNEEQFFDNLISWINHQQPDTVYRHQLYDITEAVKAELGEEALSMAVSVQMPVDQNSGATVGESDTLLSGYEEAKSYNPVDEEDSSLPELFVAGEVNLAYEEAMRKDGVHGKDTTKVTVDSDDLEDYMAVVDSAEFETVLESPSSERTSVQFGDDQVALRAQDENVKAEDNRPVYKVEREPEPYFDHNDNVMETNNSRLKELVDAVGWTRLIMSSLVIVASILLIAWLLTYIFSGEAEEETAFQSTTIAPSSESFIPLSADVIDDTKMVVQEVSVLPDYLQYKGIDEEALKIWLQRNERLLGEEPHFSTVLTVAEVYDINPLLMFAITGQEQSFVPIDHEYADQMINNPFNVYGSWETYNTDLEDSASIAAVTVLNASEGRPEDEDPVVWINQKYAEDPNWATGVTMILEQLEIVAGY